MFNFIPMHINRGSNKCFVQQKNRFVVLLLRGKKCANIIMSIAISDKRLWCSYLACLLIHQNTMRPHVLLKAYYVDSLFYRRFTAVLLQLHVWVTKSGKMSWALAYKCSTVKYGRVYRYVVQIGFVFVSIQSFAFNL